MELHHSQTWRHRILSFKKKHILGPIKVYKNADYAIYDNKVVSQGKCNPRYALLFSN